jgi:hypothetical protein
MAVVVEDSCLRFEGKGMDLMQVAVSRKAI